MGIVFPETRAHSARGLELPNSREPARSWQCTSLSRRGGCQEGTRVSGCKYTRRWQCNWQAQILSGLPELPTVGGWVTLWKGTFGWWCDGVRILLCEEILNLRKQEATNLSPLLNESNWVLRIGEWSLAVKNITGTHEMWWRQQGGGLRSERNLGCDREGQGEKTVNCDWERFSNGRAPHV